MEIFEKLNEISHSYLPQLFSGIFVPIMTVLIGFVFGKIVEKVVKRILNEAESDRHIHKLIKIKFPLENFVSSISAYFIYLFTILFALKQAGITATFFMLLLVLAGFLASVGIISKIRYFIPNFFAGFKKRKGLKKNKTLKTSGLEGAITRKTFSDVEITNRQGEKIVIPYIALTKKKVRPNN